MISISENADRVTVSNDGALRFEAENLDLQGFQTEARSGSGASGDRYISLRDAGEGEAAGVFDGEAGTYQVEVGYFDESDGQSTVSVDVDGNTSQFRFDEDLPSRLPSPETQATKVTHDAVDLEPGDGFSIAAQADTWEFARVDYIDFTQIGDDTTGQPDDAPGDDAEDDTADATDEPDDATPDDPQDDTADAADPPSDTSSEESQDGTADAAAPPDDTADAPGDPNVTAFEREVLQLTNAFRQENGRDPLQFDDQLNVAADGHSQDMASNDFFSHTGSDGSNAGERIDATGYDWSAWGENIAAGYATPEDVVDGWINSPGHRANLLDADFEEIGIGYVNVANDSSDAYYDHYWTQVFADPAEDSPSATMGDFGLV